MTRLFCFTSTTVGVLKMRLSVAFLIGTAVAAMPLLSVTASSAYPDRVTGARSSHYINIAESCPPGEHWEEAGYVAEGKWREAHCAKDGGRE
jgi:hypothetical protein